MADDRLQQKLIEYIEDAHAMEQNVSLMLDSMISSTDDPDITEMLRHHKEETARQEQRLAERLEALGAKYPLVSLCTASYAAPLREVEEVS